MRRNMWANAAVVSLPEIAVHAENLIAGRIPGVSQMIQHGTAAASSVADCPPKRTPVIGTVVVHVIQGQKPRFRLATTSANIPAIRHDRFVPDLLPVIAATLSLFRGRANSSDASTLSAAPCSPRDTRADIPECRADSSNETPCPSRQRSRIERTF